jgi:hypothetical protein
MSLWGLQPCASSALQELSSTTKVKGGGIWRWYASKRRFEAPGPSVRSAASTPVQLPGPSPPAQRGDRPRTDPGAAGPHPGRPRAEASPPEGESGRRFAMRSPALCQRGFVGASVTALSPSLPAPGIHPRPRLAILESAQAQAEDPQPLDLLSPPRCVRAPGATGRSPPFRSVGGVPRR